MVALDQQDFTDFTDYGFSSDPLSDNRREDFALGAGDGLDEQDFTDRADYGSSLDPLSGDVVVPQDFNLGDGKGLDTQDFTDLTEYGAVWFAPDETPRTNVDVTGVEGIGEVGHACPVIYNGIPEPSPSYTEITDPSAIYATIAVPSPSYTDITDPSATWVDISGNPADWEPVDDC
jgi:hypothetical protein